MDQFLHTVVQELKQVNTGLRGVRVKAGLRPYIFLGAIVFALV